MAEKAARRIFVLQLHREVEEMSSAELISHILVKYASLLSYIKSDIGAATVDTAEKSFTLMITELSDRFCIPKAEVVAHANATLAMIKGVDGSSNAAS